MHGDQLASIVGSIEFVVPADGMTGSLTAQAVDTANGEVDYDGNLALLWTLSDGGSVGNMRARSMSAVSSGPVYNVSSVFMYGHNAFLVEAMETVAAFLVNAKGAYGGDANDWYAVRLCLCVAICDL